MGNYSGLSRWAQCHHSSLEQEDKRARVREVNVRIEAEVRKRERERFEDTMLLTLQMEEGSRSQGMPLRS